jgi:hypothetical protein
LTPAFESLNGSDSVDGYLDRIKINFRGIEDLLFELHIKWEFDVDNWLFDVVLPFPEFSVVILSFCPLKYFPISPWGDAVEMYELDTWIG